MKCGNCGLSKSSANCSCHVYLCVAIADRMREELALCLEQMLESKLSVWFGNSSQSNTFDCRSCISHHLLLGISGRVLVTSWLRALRKSVCRNPSTSSRRCRAAGRKTFCGCFRSCSHRFDKGWERSSSCLNSHSTALIAEWHSLIIKPSFHLHYTVCNYYLPHCQLKSLEY